MKSKENNNDNIQTLGEYLKILREQRALSQEDVAFKLNIERSSYSHYETNQTIPSVPMLRSIAKVFDIPVISLFNLTDPDELTFDIYLEEAKAMAEYEKKVGSNTQFKDLPISDKRLLFYANNFLNSEELEELTELFRFRYTKIATSK
ncbi:MAG: helix-turn-helix domain-containing protein [Lachnospiraceae bacterium]|nr:helix-turn-helix domain-containing protein [Lachnospiraceae bacterium]